MTTTHTTVGTDTTNITITEEVVVVTVVVQVLSENAIILG